jgi:NADH dehydrogenase
MNQPRHSTMELTDTDNIVIVGGGAGGLELACKLGRKFGPQRVTLVERTFYHVWKPSLHEVAAGTVDMHQEALAYTMLAHRNRFTFVYGAFTRVDVVRKTIVVAAVEEGAGELVNPERILPFSRLCIAVGGTANYFDTPGAAQYTMSLNGAADAEAFRMEMLKKMTWAQHRKGQDRAGYVNLVIVGGGATGVELAAELREASKRYIDYGLRQLDPVKDVRITLIEGAGRILPLLPARISAAAANMLEERAVTVVPACRVAQVSERSVRDASGRAFPYDICVWAAGIRAPRFLATLGLPVNHLGQLEVTQRLHVRGQPRIYALGDCAASMMADGSKVPPRAQAAHQQADYLYRAFVRESRGRAPSGAPFVYRDNGALVSIGVKQGVGTVMGPLRGRSWFVRGAAARLVYLGLHLRHHCALLGWLRAASVAFARTLIGRTKALVKLH